MRCKFKYGDKVKVKDHSGKIVSIKKGIDGFICRIKFDNKFLMPPEMDYKEYELDMVEPSGPPKGVKCTCGIQATYGNIPFENHSDYCNLRDKTTENDLLEQFEIMLGSGGDDDDEDDFGYYDI